MIILPVSRFGGIFLRPLRYIFVEVSFTTEVLVGEVIRHAYCGDDGKLHIVYDSGIATAFPPEPEQVGCDRVLSDMAVFSDRCAIYVERRGNRRVPHSPRQRY